MKVLATALLALVIAGQAGGAEAQTRVDGRVEASAHATVYRYQVRNQGPDPISSVFIGLVSGMDEPELASAPLGWEASTHDCPASIVAPHGWKGCVGRQEESGKVFLVFDAVDEKHWLAAGSSMPISVKLAQGDATYRTPMFWAIRSRGESDKGKVTAQPSR